MTEINFPNLNHVRGESAIYGFAASCINQQPDELTTDDDDRPISFGDPGAEIEATQDGENVALVGGKQVSGNQKTIIETYFNITGGDDDNIGIGVWNGDFSNVAGTVYYPTTGELNINGTVETTVDSLGTFTEQYVRLEVRGSETRLILKGDVEDEVEVSEGAGSSASENFRIVAESSGGDNTIVVPWVKQLMIPESF